MMAAPSWVYLYCIVRRAAEQRIDGCTAVGTMGGSVFTICQGDLAVVASASPAERYETTRANMLAHERVLERVMRDFTLLPIRFSTVTSATTATADIRRLLDHRRAEFHHLLDEVQGKAEQGLKVFWRDEGLIFRELLSRHETMRRLQREIQGKPPAATHFDRIRLGEMLKAALDNQRVAEAAAILDPLRRLATRTVENPAIVDRMVANAAFLVDRSLETEFDDLVGQLAEAHQGRMQFKYVGPVPPYNFVNVIVNWQAV